MTSQVEAGAEPGSLIFEAGAEPGSLIFPANEPPRLLRRIVDRSLVLFPFLAAAVLLAGGELGTLTVIALIFLVTGLVLRAAAWLIGRRDPHQRARRERREIVLSASLVGRVRSLQRQDRRAEAATLLQGETDLGLGDTARALRLIEETGRAG